MKIILNFHHGRLNRFLICTLSSLLLTGRLPQAQAVTVTSQANSIDSQVVSIRFDQTVTPPTAINVDNYTIYTKKLSGNSVVVTNAILQNDGQTVALYLNQSVGEFFSVSAANLTNGLGTLFSDTPSSYPSDFTSISIGTNGDPNPSGEAISLLRDSYNVTGGGSDIGGTNDHCRQVYRQVVGDFEMIAYLADFQLNFSSNITNNSIAKAGLMARESLAAGARSVGAYYTPVQLLVNTNPMIQPYLTNQIRMVTRSTTNGVATTNTIVGFSPSLGASSFYNWLRMTRSGNIFTTYYGTNGSTWTTNSSVTLALSSTVDAGLAVTSHTNGATATASFKAFGVNGSRPGDGSRPTASAYIYNTTNLIVKWQRNTARDFTVQVCTNLFAGTNASSLTESNSTQWGFLMIPVFDTALTGTNAAVPTSGRYMTIPTDLFGNSPMFVRLAQVEKVIPDPVGVTPGVIFSQASGSLKTAPAGYTTLGGVAVVSATAVAQTNTPIICPIGATPGKYSYQITTVPSGGTYNTILLVRNFPVIGQSNTDISFSAGSGKSQVTLTPASPNTGYTFVTAATTTPPVCSPIMVQVNIFTNF